jgi:hypothetical protein
MLWCARRRFDDRASDGVALRSLRYGDCGRLRGTIVHGELGKKPRAITGRDHQMAINMLAMCTTLCAPVDRYRCAVTARIARAFPSKSQLDTQHAAFRLLVQHTAYRYTPLI